MNGSTFVYWGALALDNITVHDDAADIASGRVKHRTEQYFLLINMLSTDRLMIDKDKQRSREAHGHLFA